MPNRAKKLPEHLPEGAKYVLESRDWISCVANDRIREIGEDGRHHRHVAGDIPQGACELDYRRLAFRDAVEIAHRP